MQAPGDKRLAVLRRTVGHPAITLICVPFAGGNPEMFSSWAGWLANGIDLLAVRLPGHGRRMREAPFGTWNELIDDTYNALTPYLTQPHAFYGHCFGGRLAYELAHRAADGHVAMTKRLFVSGCRSPDAPPASEYVHLMSDSEFRSVLAQTRVAPTEVLANAALMRILLPAVRSEVRLAELWDDWHGSCLDVPITAMYGQDDQTEERRGMTGWAAFSTQECEFIEVPGNHFFVQTNPPLLRDIVNSRLAMP